MDEKDLAILEILKEHAEYTTRQIAKKTRLPITTVHNRIKKLKEEKIIKKFTIEINPEKINKNFKVYILISVSLHLLKQNKRTQYDVAKDLRKYEFVEKVDIVTGGTDIMATIGVKDVEEFNKILLQKIQLIPEIENTQSLITIHKEK
jgi:Lrp/AsnC family transcriptional regulator, leucine-responsive regulatory protein